VLECLYVGMTSKTPAQRFQQHKTGYRNTKGIKLSAYIPHKYGFTFVRVCMIISM
jgi:predicted GIY-YIG superfamily endonuclease